MEGLIYIKLAGFPLFTWRRNVKPMMGVQPHRFL